jgi:membrane associated rhomboid family serine protease
VARLISYGSISYAVEDRIHQFKPLTLYVRRRSPIAPANWMYWFFTVEEYPSCSDLRPQAFRLISFGLTHAGLLHIGGNTIAGVVYGSLLETLHPLHYAMAFVVFQVGVMVSALGHSFAFPYRGLIGCSGGCYALIGSCAPIVILHEDKMRRNGVERFCHGVMCVTLLAQVKNRPRATFPVHHFRLFDQ